MVNIHQAYIFKQQMEFIVKKMNSYFPIALNHEVFSSYSKLNDSKFGLICIPCLLNQFSVSELKEFMELNAISIPSNTQTKIGLIEQVLDAYSKQEVFKKRAKEINLSRIELLGHDLTHFTGKTLEFDQFDFITEVELRNVFANFCADIGITVFKPVEGNEYGISLYLTKKDPILKTEAVFLATGKNIEKRYKDFFFQLSQSAEISDWQLLVTTPLGALKLGLHRLKQDMKKLGVWLYIVDPAQVRIFGITKGPKSKQINLQMQEKFIHELPSQPIRAPNQAVKFSTFLFSEKESYKPADYSLFYIPTKNHPQPVERADTSQKYRKIFQTLLLMTLESGISFCSYSSEEYKIEDIMISGFISAIDSFVQELSGSGGLKQIDYQNFKITAVVGELCKIILITSESADEELQERLTFYLNRIESSFGAEIQNFSQTGNQSNVSSDDMIDLAKKILLI